jgi:hypothetical protein
MSQIDPGHTHHDPPYLDFRGECPRCFGAKLLCEQCNEAPDWDDGCLCDPSGNSSDAPKLLPCDLCEGTGEAPAVTR